MVVIAIFRVIKAPFIDGNLSIIDCYAEAVHVFRNFVHVIKNRLVGAPVHVIEKTVHVHENCCSRVLRILSWLGVCPGNNESAGQIKSGRTPHGQRLIKKVLTECAQAACHTKGSHLAVLFGGWKHKGFCKAVMAVAHKLALLIHWVVVNQKPYIDKEFDYTGVFKQDGQRRPRWIRALRRYGLMTLADVEKEKAARGWIIAKA